MSSVLDGVDQRTQLVGHNRLELLLFRLHGEQTYGINVFKVQEVIQCPQLTQLPHSNYVVKGVANMRGKTIPVIDMSMSVGMACLGDVTDLYVIITEFNRTTLGFVVRSVDRIVNMNWQEILPPPKGGRNGYLTAVTKVDDRLVEIIDVEKILSEVMGAPESDAVAMEGMEEMASEIPRHVLVADDSSVARKQMKRALDQVGIESTLVCDGKEALETLLKWADEGDINERILMVISDIEMPEMDGYTLTLAVRKDPRLEGLYVLLHSSLSGVFNQSMVTKVGANDFIAKFNPTEFSAAVQNRLQLRLEELETA